MSTSIDQEICLSSAAAFLTALGNAKRLEVLYLLSEKEIGVSRLAEMIGVSQSSLSQHLAKLRREGLVQWRRSAQQIYYRCDSEPARRMLRLIKTTFMEAEPKLSVISLPN